VIFWCAPKVVSGWGGWMVGNRKESIWQEKGRIQGAVKK